MIRGRAARLVGAGLVDSFGLSLGWTIFNLKAVEREGLVVVGGYNAALLVGIALSAPFTGWLSSRVGGRGLMQLTASVEAALRIGAFGLSVAVANALVTETLVRGATQFDAGALGTFEVRGDQVMLGKPFVFNRGNIDRFNF